MVLTGCTGPPGAFKLSPLFDISVAGSESDPSSVVLSL